jgi:L-amino acid N-acyltransferase YncA
MPVFTGSLEFERISKPMLAPALKGFSCGDHRYDKAVDGLVARQHSGEAVYSPTVMVMTDEGRTAGICAWRLQPLPSDELVLPDDFYVHMIGLSRHYREHWEEDGTSLGSVLMKGMLEEIKADGPGNSMPAVWACIAPFNKKSHRLFGDHGFATRKPVKGDIIRFRPPGLEP